MAIYTPYPIDGTVYDRDGSTLVPAKVVCLNATTGEKISTTAIAGVFMLDLANFASGYTHMDRLQITVMHGSGSGVRSLTRRHTVNTNVGAYSIGNMVLHAGEESFADCNIQFAGATNSSAGGLYVDFFDRNNDMLVFRIECGAGLSVALPFGYIGVKMDGGFIRVFESETSGELEALVIKK